MLLSLSIPLLLAVSLAVSVVHGVLLKFYNRCSPANKQSVWFFNAAMGMVCLVFIVIYAINPQASDPFATIKDFSLVSVLLGAVFGLFILAQTFTLMRALDIGPFSYTTVIVSLSTLISALSGLFYGETLDAWQIVGMGVMVLCIVFSTARGKDGQKKASLRWLVLSLVSCVANGGIGVIQKIHQSSEYKSQNVAFLITAFACISIVSFMAWKLEGRKNAGERMKPTGKQIILACACGALFAVPHTANLYLAGQLPSVVCFPVLNTGSLVLTLASAVIIFREKLTRLQWLGIVLGILSGMLVSGTFSAIL